MSAALHDVASLEAQAGVAMGACVRLAAIRDSQADAPDLPVRERDRRRGRAALAGVLTHFGRTEQAGDVCFPHRELSLSHSGEWAIAAGCEAAGGVGVDLEFARPMDPRAARFFLTCRELAHVDTLPRDRQQVELLRLWTIKEAVFKACTDNAGRLLADFELDAPAASAGTARSIDGGAFTSRYCSIDLGEAWLAIALATTTVPATEPPA